MIQSRGADCILNDMQRVHVLGRVQVVDAQQLLQVHDALVGEHRLPRLLVHCVVFVQRELRYDARQTPELLGVIFDGTGDDQGGASLVDEDGVDLVDDRKVVTPLHEQVEARLHVVAQVVEAELVVLPVA